MFHSKRSRIGFWLILIGLITTLTIFTFVLKASSQAQSQTDNFPSHFLPEVQAAFSSDLIADVPVLEKELQIDNYQDSPSNNTSYSDKITAKEESQTTPSNKGESSQFSSKLSSNPTTTITAPKGSTATLYSATNPANPRRPIVIFEGYDPDNEFTTESLYNSLNNSLSQGLLDSLRANNQIDSWLVNWYDGGQTVEILAEEAKDLLRRINTYSGNQNNTIVLGFSLGGLASRYALADAYAQNPNDNLGVKKFMTYDTPHRGAWVNETLKDVAIRWSQGAQRDKLWRFVYAPGAQEMVQFGSDYVGFYNRLHSKGVNGYNPNIEKVAFTNGGYGNLGDGSDVIHDFGSGNQMFTIWYSPLCLGNGWPEVIVNGTFNDYLPGDKLIMDNFYTSNLLACGKGEWNFHPTFIPTHSALDFDGVLESIGSSNYEYKNKNQSPFNRVYLTRGVYAHDDFSPHSESIAKEILANFQSEFLQPVINLDSNPTEEGEPLGLSIIFGNPTASAVTLEFGDGCQVHYYIDGVRDKWLCTSSLTYVTIPPFGKYVWNKSYNPAWGMLTPGRHTITTGIFKDTRGKEYGRGETTIEVYLRRPELSLNNLKITGLSLSPNDSLINQESKISIDLKNARAKTNNTKVNFYDGDPKNGGQLISSSQITSMEPGNNQKITVNWTPTQTGIHKIYTVVDPDNAINETDENNNQINTDVMVYNKKLYVDAFRGNDSYDGIISTVSGSQGPKKTLRAAINLGSSYNIIQVAPGIYDDNYTTALDLKEGMKLVSDNPRNTIVKNSWAIRLAKNNHISGLSFVNGSGGLVHYGDGTGSIVVENCIIKGGNGSGIRIENVEQTLIKNNLIFGLVFSGLDVRNSRVSIINNTLDSNGDNGIYFYASQGGFIGNNIISNNKNGYGVFDQSQKSVVSNNNFYNNKQGAYFGYIPDSTNVLTNPLFINLSQELYYLNSSSPAINAGSTIASNLGLDSLTTLQDQAPDSGPVDLGFHYMVDKTAPEVSIFPAAGTYSSPQTITLSASEPDSVIYYTTDGSIPTTSSTKYTTSFTIGKTTTIKYFAVDRVGNQSKVETKEYIIESFAFTWQFNNGKTSLFPGESANYVIELYNRGGNYDSYTFRAVAPNNWGLTLSHQEIDLLEPNVQFLFGCFIKVSANATPGNYTISMYTKSKTTGEEKIVTKTITVLNASKPTGTIKINGDASYTNSPQVTLNLSANSPVGIKSMQFSNDRGVTWTPPEPYQTNKPWTLSSGDDLKFVYVKFIDQLDQKSDSYSDTITLDTIAPTGSISINSGATYTTSTSVTLTLTYSDATSGVSQVRYSNWSTGQIWESPSGTKPWTLFSGNGVQIVFYEIKDKAGLSSMYAYSIILDTMAPTVTATPASGTYLSPQTIALGANEAVSVIYYTTDNSIPTTSSNKYTTPITISQTTTLKFKAIDLAGNQSGVKSEVYTINYSLPTPLILTNSGQFPTNNKVLSLFGTIASHAIKEILVNGSSQGVVYSPGSLVWGYEGILQEGQNRFEIVAKNNDVQSEPAVITVTLDTQAPILTVSPRGGTYNSSQAVTISTNEAANIFYTTDGTIPECNWNSSPYIQPITISQTTTLKFIASDRTAGNRSEVYTEIYTIDTQPPVATATPAAGTYSLPQTITLSSNKPATIYYTTDGSIPTISSSRYSSPLTIAQTTVLKFMAVDQTGNKSEVKTGVYTINQYKFEWNYISGFAFFYPGDAPTHKLKLKNMGNVTDVYNVRVEIPQGWSAPQLSQATAQLTPQSDTLIESTFSIPTNAQNNSYLIAWYAKSQATGEEKKISQTFYIQNAPKPYGSIAIGGGLYTRNQNVRLNLSASSPVGIESMKFSSDNQNWSNLEPYQTSKTWTLSSGDGYKYIYVKFIDKLGQESDPTSSGVYLDTTAPRLDVSLISGLYPVPQLVYLHTTDLSNTTIYYTLDDSLPTIHSNQYNQPLNISQTSILKFLAVDQAGNQSEVKTEKYTIDARPRLTINLSTGSQTISVPSTITDFSIFGAGAEVKKYNPTNGQYEDVTFMIPFEGYWLKVPTTRSVEIPIDDINLASVNSINFPEGLNLISSFWLEHKDQLKLTSNGETKTLAEAIDAGWIKDKVYYYENGQYHYIDLRNYTPEQIKGKSFWLRAYQTVSLSLN